MPTAFHRVRILANRRSGVRWSFDRVQRAFDRHFDRSGTEVTYQFCHSKEDCVAKVDSAVRDGIELLVAIGGDGTINTIGSRLLGTPLVLGVVPVGSGNGLARHFEMPLDPEKAVESLAKAAVARIDVGLINGRAFLVTASMAWDAALVRTFEKFPVRGILPYVFAGVSEFLDYKPQAITVRLDSGETLNVPDPLVFTVANLTQYGGGAVIAPQAKADDGQLELVVLRRDDVPFILANLHNLLSGALTDIPQFLFRRFRSLTAQRASAAPIQVDGELAEAPAVVEVSLRPGALQILVPR
jgi:diacylglycerol kinase family enzyme